jgi:hypothetical protein
MDLTIDLDNFRKENLNVKNPKRIWLNLWGKRNFLTEDYEKILSIFGTYSSSEIILMNSFDEDKKNLKYLFQDYSRVKVLDK